MIGLLLIVLVFGVIAYALVKRKRSAVVATDAHLDAALVSLGPVIAGTIADIDLLGQPARGIAGTYRGHSVAAWLEKYADVDLYGGSHPRWSFHLCAEHLDGAALWQVSYVHLLHGDRWRFDATDEALTQRLETEGLLDAVAPLTGVGATVTYLSPQHRLLAGWPYETTQTWPNPAEFAARLDILLRLIGINQHANAVTPT